jgi:non-specific serine/threonine protein kinase
LDSPEPSFGALLKRLRLERRLSQEELAERAKMSVAAISALERGSRQSPYRSSVDLLADGLGIDCEARTELHALAEQWRKARTLPRRSVDPSSSRPPSQKTPNNLPLQLTSFIGRNREVDEVRKLLRENRLVTLVGSGGVGKTRCAIAVGAEVFDDFGDGVRMVELAPISHSSELAANSGPGQVIAQVAQTLKVREEPTSPLLETVLAHLNQRRVLLIFDNCEHVIDEVRRVTAAILRTCQNVRVLATSLEGLHITGERIFRLPSLAVPRESSAITAETAHRYGSVSLFSDRARASDARFTLDDDNAPFVAEVCRRLDGIPLAIELAAARVRVLKPRELAQMLDKRFRVLTGGDRSALPRHRTMRALIDWSYDLLSEQERRLFSELSIFTGSFTLEIASAVCSDLADEISVLELLSSLVDKSLVQTDPTAATMRYRMLESTRQYAREKLVERGEYHRVARAHSAALLALAERLENDYEATPDRDWFAAAELELENWRSVLEWALVERADTLTGQKLAGVLRRVWSFLAPADGRRWVGVALETTDDATPALVIALLELSQAALDAALVQYKACYAAAQNALARYRVLRDPLKVAETQRHAGTALMFMGKLAEAEAMLGEALATAQAENAQKLGAAILECMASARSRANDFSGARRIYAEALSVSNVIEPRTLASARIMANLAELEFRSGNASEALSLVGQALATNRALIYADSAAQNLCNMAAYLVSLGRYDEARVHAVESLQMLHGLQNDVAALFALQHLAACAALGPNAKKDRGRFTLAAKTIGYVDRRLGVLEASRQYTEEQEYVATVAALKTVLGSAFDRLTAEGGAWDETEAMAQAPLL